MNDERPLHDWTEENLSATNVIVKNTIERIFGAINDVITLDEILGPMPYDDDDSTEYFRVRVVYGENHAESFAFYINADGEVMS